MKYFSSYLCLIILSITMASCDKFFGEELTDLIFDHGKFEMPDKALFIGNSLLLGNGAFGMNATDSESDYHAIIQRKFFKSQSGLYRYEIIGSRF